MIRVTKVIAEQVETLMRKVAEEEILPRYRKPHSSDCEQKPDYSVVALADKKSEEALIQGLLNILPQAIIASRKSSESNPSILNYFAEGRLSWIINPLDGRANFASGDESRKNSGMSVALVEDDQICGSWILDIHRKTMTHAIAGEGAFHEGERIKVKKDLSLDFSTAVAYPNASYFTKYPDLANRNFRLFAEQIAARMCPDNIQALQCSSLEYVTIVLGKALLGFNHFNTPWNHAAGQLIIHEAGGHAGFIDGRYRPSVESNKDMLILYAHNRKIAEDIRHLFKAMKKEWDKEKRTERTVFSQQPAKIIRRPFERKPKQLTLAL